MRLSVSRVAGAFVRRRTSPLPPTDRPRGSRRRRARIALALTPPALVLVVCAAWVAVPAGAETPDAEYDARLAIARTAQTEHPDRPLGLVIGTSRTTAAFRPEWLADTAGVYWVNAGRVGAGPGFSRVMLSRFLRDGVRPAVVVFEVMPALFAIEDPNIFFAHLGPRDLGTASWCSDRPFEYDLHILQTRLRRLAGPPPAPHPFAARPVPYHPRGGYPYLEADVEPAERARRTEVSRACYGAALRTLTVRAAADRAFRGSLRAAADAGIRVVLLRAPEGPVFQSWYDPDALTRFDEYLARVAGEYGVPVVDARSWLDEGDFSDSHHTLTRGAEKFTARFAREARAVLSGP